MKTSFFKRGGMLISIPWWQWHVCKPLETCYEHSLVPNWSPQLWTTGPGAHDMLMGLQSLPEEKRADMQSSMCLSVYNMYIIPHIITSISEIWASLHIKDENDNSWLINWLSPDMYQCPLPWIQHTSCWQSVFCHKTADTLIGLLYQPELSVAD